jgi:serine/threonine protein kinase
MIPPDLAEAQQGRVMCRNCGASLRVSRKKSRQRGETSGTSTTDRLQGVTIPGYDLLGRLGKGGMASVFSGVQTATGRRVAVKVLPPSSAGNPDLVLRFEREAKILASLTHPNVVQVIDRGRVGNIYYFIMEYIPGRTLKERMDEGPISIEEIAHIVTRVGEAIQYCHDHGLVHRDLKPGNVLLNTGGEVKVTDFGISGLIQQLGEITEQGVMIGTPQYVAPEQLRDGSRIDHRADQYSLAVLAYEMLTHSLPVGAFQPVSEKRPDAPKRLDDVLRKALSRDPRDRFRTIREFLHEFRRAVFTPAPSPPALAEPSAQGGQPDATKKDGGSGAEPAPASTEAYSVRELRARAGAAPPPTRQGTLQTSDALNEMLQSLRTASPDAPTKSRARKPAQTAAQKREQQAKSGAWRWRVIGILGVLILSAAVILRFRSYKDEAEQSAKMTFVGGMTAPAQIKPPLLKSADLSSALKTPGPAAYMVATRTQTGQWVVDPNLFRCSQLETLLGTFSFYLTDSTLISQADSGWRWREGLGLALTTQTDGVPARLMLAVASPFRPAAVCKALAETHQAVERGLDQLPVRPVEAYPNMLLNGDFALPISATSGFPSWGIMAGGAEASTINVLTNPQPGNGEPGRWVRLGGANDVRGIRQSFNVTPGSEHVLTLLARSPEGQNGWLAVGMELASAGKSVESAATAPPARFYSAWRLDIQTESAWKRFQVRWVCDETMVAPQARLTLSSYTVLVEAADLRVQALPVFP